MAKGKTFKKKVKYREGEVIHVFNGDSAILVFNDLPDDPTRCRIEVVLPEEKLLEDREYSQSITMAMAMANRLMEDEEFAPDMLNWMQNRMEQAEREQMSAEQIVEANSK